MLLQEKLRTVFADPHTRNAVRGSNLYNDLHGILSPVATVARDHNCASGDLSRRQHSKDRLNEVGEVLGLLENRRLFAQARRAGLLAVKGRCRDFSHLEQTFHSVMYVCDRFNIRLTRTTESNINVDLRVWLPNELAERTKLFIPLQSASILKENSPSARPRPLLIIRIRSMTTVPPKHAHHVYAADTIPPTLATRIGSASVGALITSLVTNPLDVIKTRMQAPAQLALGAPTSVSATQSASAVATLMRVARLEGMGVLWSGLGPALLMAVPSSVTYFAVYDELKTRLQRRGAGTALADFAPLLAGIAGRSVTVAIVSPLELLRTRAMHRRSNISSGLLGAWRAEVKLGGLSSLWRGLGPTLWRDVPFSGIYWMGYEGIKNALGGNDGRRDLARTLSVAFVAGVTSGAVAATVTTPFDVLKTRRQVARGTALTASTATGTVSLLLQLWRNEGAAGLFSGLPARVAKVAPSCAIMISTYEAGKVVFTGLVDVPSGDDVALLDVVGD